MTTYIVKSVDGFGYYAGPDERVGYCCSRTTYADALKFTSLAKARTAARGVSTIARRAVYRVAYVLKWVGLSEKTSRDRGGPYYPESTVHPDGGYCNAGTRSQAREFESFAEAAAFRRNTVGTRPHHKGTPNYDGLAIVRTLVEVK